MVDIVDDLYLGHFDEVQFWEARYKFQQLEFLDTREVQLTHIQPLLVLRFISRLDFEDETPRRICLCIRCQHPENPRP